MTSPQPKHLALIMDGNGRWAQKRNKNRFWGHLKGSEIAEKIVEHCARNTEIEYLTLYAFSTENWSRPTEEVNFLFKLLERHLIKKQDHLNENKVRLMSIGDLSPLPQKLQRTMASAIEKTAQNDGLKLVLALNYGGRQELLSKINQHFSSSDTPLDEDSLDKLITSDGIPHPDLIIRTSGEQRLSNFMLWQAAYSELYFTKTLWPDFTENDLDEALSDFSRRQRRFGAVPLRPVRAQV
jgi:undecaprenyl diphosphate synthase